MRVSDWGYRAIVGLAKGGFRALDQRLSLSGAEHVPLDGPYVLACNHISYVDFVYAGYAAQPRLVRFMAKREIFDHPVGGPVMRTMRHISVDRAQGDASVRVALRYLAEGEAVGIFPEATISRTFELKEFKSGAVRLAASAGVPVVPMAVWGTQRLLTKGHPRDLTRHRPISMVVGPPLMPQGRDPVAESDALRAAMSSLLVDAITGYADGQPTGAWWLPASYGGGAPTAEEAKVLESEERARRLAARRRKTGSN